MNDPQENDASTVGDVGLACSAFEDAWRKNPPADIAEFLRGWEEPQRGELFCELVKIDLDHRTSTHFDNFSPEEYYLMFPEYESAIDTALREVSDVTRDTAWTANRVRQPIELKEGDQVGDFDLVRKIGAGAFAVVYLAYERSMMRHVALKVSLRGRDEPPTLGQLDHPNIVRVHGVTRPDGEKGLQLMPMEFVGGGTLQSVSSKVLRCMRPPDSGELLLETIRERAEATGGPAQSDSTRSGQLSVASWGDVVCQLGIQLADALFYAHCKGILHRDIKPANVLLTPDGVPKLADFNIAYGSHVSKTSAAGYFGGTVAYMSPEQLAACDPNNEIMPEDVDHRSDIYSLAVVLWELLAGRHPFEDDLRSSSSTSPADQVRSEINEKAIASLPASTPVGLQEVLCKCLDTTPESRYQSAGELARDLRLCNKPRVQTVLRALSSPLLRWVYCHPLLASILIGLLPNFLLSVANVAYDYRAIVKPLGADRQFLEVITWGKALLYLVGIGYGVWGTVHVFLELWKIPTNPPTKPPMRLAKLLGSVFTSNRPRAQLGCLKLGDLVLAITLATWLLSGMFFPLIMHLRGGQLEPRHFALFFAAHLLCGVISANLVVFTLSYLQVRLFYPRLLVGELDCKRLRAAHQSLRLRLEIYFFLAVAAPFVSALALGLSLSNNETNYWPAFLVLGVLGALVFGLANVSKAETNKNLAAMDEYLDVWESYTPRAAA